MNTNRALKSSNHKEREQKKNGTENNYKNKQKAMNKMALSTHLSIIGEGNDTPLQHSCLENPMDRGAR